ncbi:hypothetical protein COEREDRAFT_79249 [Coemansia reversa NRRL 1564]|uniref:RING-type domain-containing protein n=1 Tax=Coemansia reversa (strain ATCC 12441 / NRRL 1564) TaxID=763665 RepID=A0A2G5BJZ9_COERN|nr:hypothetical protein COEREDRAFT_79249 [Coemansia reversa NRRL 1564]|eukprot:PIA19302.1 hypothetical protein COEREDRAFT_79249 [Coemansia reversa NRRL 1564]
MSENTNLPPEVVSGSGQYSHATSQHQPDSSELRERILEEIHGDGLDADQEENFHTSEPFDNTHDFTEIEAGMDYPEDHSHSEYLSDNTQERELIVEVERYQTPIVTSQLQPQSDYITLDSQFSPQWSNYASNAATPTVQVVHDSPIRSATPSSSYDLRRTSRQNILPDMQGVSLDDRPHGRKHPLHNTTTGHSLLDNAETSKRPRLDNNATVNRAGVATLLNPEPSTKDDDDASENAAEGAGKRSRILFKCAVCLDMPNPAVFAHPCGHVFCEMCAQGAVQTTMRCPVCRHSMRVKDIRVLQFKVAKIGR